MDRSPPLVGALLERCTFPPPGTIAVCGVSGGADSLALLVLAVAAGLEVTAVHVDHGLREGSADEAEVVRAAAAWCGAAFRSERVELTDASDLEARARRARRAVLGPDAMTGHTADDQAETVLINLLRGAGPTGIAAMRAGYRHPILGLRRAETMALCVAVGLDPVIDASNRDPRFQRNRVRHELLPLMESIAGRDVRPLLVRSSQHVRAAADFISASADHVDGCSVADLRAADPVLAREALRGWLGADGYAPNTADLDRVWRVVLHEVVACEISGGRRVSRTEGRLRVWPA